MGGQGYDVIVIGAGIAGLTAAIASARAGLATASVESSMFGGLVVNVNQLDGETTGSGADLASDLMTQAMDLGVHTVSETVRGLARDDRGLQVTTDAGAHRARAIIVASGARLRRLGVPGEVELEHKGVSHCADCDGPLFKGEDVVVVGGGDSALQAAAVLAVHARQVHLVHRGRRFRGRQHLVDALGRHDNIRPVFDTVVEAILGSAMVESVRVRNGVAGRVRAIPCAGFFAYVGLQPSADFAPSELRRDTNGSVITDGQLCTSMPGVFAAGAVRAGYGGMLADAMADGNAAASSARSAVRG